MIASCGVCILSRSSLNLIDGYLFKKKDTSFLFLYLTSIFLPFVYGFFVFPLFGNVSFIVEEFFSLRCFFAALTANLVGLSFSYAFRHKDVKHVVIHSKIPELILPFLIILIFPKTMMPDEISWRHFAPLALTWISFIPYFLMGKHQSILFDRAAVYLFFSLLLQMVVSSTLAFSMSSMFEILTFTVAILLWRCILSLPLCLKKENKNESKIPVFSWSLLFLIAFRGVVALSTQFTFNWAIIESNPLIVWPILNTAIIITSLASQFILKERVYLCDWIAIIGLFLSTCLMEIL